VGVKQIITRGRQLGKSTVSLEYTILKQQAEAMQKSIDKMIIDEIWALDKYRIRKSWTDRKGRQMHRIAANDEVRDWLDTEHSQYGASTPDWWKFQDSINITDKLLTLLVLRFAE
jgi:hypothetical protein